MLDAYTGGGAEVLSRLGAVSSRTWASLATQPRRDGLATPVAAAEEQLYLLGQAHGLAAADDSAVIKVVAPTRRTN